MKKLLSFVVVLISLQTFGQIYPSNCSQSSLFRSTYEWDIKNLALRQMYSAASPDTAFVHIPQTWLNPIAGGLAAILNAVAMPERDTIFNLYCVHDNAPATFFIDKQIMVTVDTTYAWTQQWRNLQTMTGNTQMDSLLTKYNLHLVTFYNWSFASVALLGTDSLWNTYALMDSLEQVPGVVYCESNSMIGTAGRINYNLSGNDRLYDFQFQWNDCFDGCDNYVTWRFRVMDDFSVEYYGRDAWGFFGIEPLPAPLNCNLFSGIAPEPSPEEAFSIYPNPSDGKILLKSDKGILTDSRVEVYSITGELLRTFIVSANEISLDLSMLREGFYTIRLFWYGIYSIRKIIIVK